MYLEQGHVAKHSVEHEQGCFGVYLKKEVEE